MNTALTVAIWAATMTWGAFLVWYTIRAKWWKHTIGQNTFGVSVVLFVLLARLALDRVNLATEATDTIGVFLYGAAALFGVQRIFFVERAQRDDG